MSLRGAESSTKNAGGTPAERRKSRARVTFEAAVTATDPAGGSAFEAESVDVSPEGMRLRTAYVPEAGERLLCRFDGPDGEVVVEGEVIWRAEEAKGGEFGIKFTALDTATEEAVRALCKDLAETDDSEDKAAAMPKGSRVRLHIEGLASPMKARVRDSDDKETLVGSNLEFLKVGRSLELEDVEKGQKREAFVDHVKVEVDAASGVPQLVVALRYDAVKAPKPAAKVAAAATASAAPSSRAASAGEKSRAAAAARDEEPEIDHDSSLDAEAVSDQPGDVDGDEKRGIAKVGASAASAGRKVVGKVGPALSGLGSNAKGAVMRLLESVRKRREDRADQKKKDAPRRMTAPPPGGALKADGKRLVRDDVDDEDGLTPPPAKKNKKAALLGSALGLLAVLAVFGITRVLAMRGTPPEPVAATTAAPRAAGCAPERGRLPGGDCQHPSLRRDPAVDDGACSHRGPVRERGRRRPRARGRERGRARRRGDDEGGAEGTKEWGEGNVRSPTTLRVKLDGDIEGFNGAKGAMGFTVVLPGRRILSSSGELQKKDKRIATFQIVNKPNAAELTIQFKDGVPAYLARAKGDKLEIMLGNEGKAKKAIAKVNKSKKKADAKKTASKGKDKKDKKGKK
jgi:hypothetical protein